MTGPVHPRHDQVDDHQGRPAVSAERIDTDESVLAPFIEKWLKTSLADQKSKGLTRSGVVIHYDHRRACIPGRRLIPFDPPSPRKEELKADVIFDGCAGFIQGAVFLVRLAPVPPLVNKSSPFHGQILRVQPLIKHELHRVHPDVVGGVAYLLKIEVKGAVAPDKERVDRFFYLIPHHLFDGVRRDAEAPDQEGAEPLAKSLPLLNGQRQFELVEIDNPFPDQDLPETLPVRTGSRLGDLAGAKKNPTFSSLAVQGKDTGFPAQADDLENFTQTEIFEVADKTHGMSMGGELHRTGTHLNS